MADDKSAGLSGNFSAGELYVRRNRASRISAEYHCSGVLHVCADDSIRLRDIASSERTLDELRNVCCRGNIFAVGEDG